MDPEASSFFASLLIYWGLPSLFFGLVGWFIGDQKGQGSAGFWWGFLCGPIGWIIVLCLRNKRKEAMAEAQLQAQWATARASRQAAAAALPPTPRRSIWHVARADGTPLGALPMQAIRDKLASRDLAEADLYFDKEADAWVALEYHPERY